MSSAAFSPSDDYQAPPAPAPARLDREAWNRVLGDVGRRLRALEAKRAELQSLIDDLSFNGQARLDETITPLIDAQRAILTTLAANIDAEIARINTLFASFEAATQQALVALDQSVADAMADANRTISATIAAIDAKVKAVSDRVDTILAGGLPAADVQESATRVFVTPAQKAQIGTLATRVTATEVELLAQADPIARSPAPPAKDIVFAEGFVPRGLTVLRATVGSRRSRFGDFQDAPPNTLRHQYGIDRKYQGVLIEATDYVEMPATSEWLKQSENTLFFEATVGNNSNISSLFTLSDGTANNRLNFQRSSASPRYGNMVCTIGGLSIINAAFSTLGPLADGQLIRLAFSTNASASRLSVNGVSSNIAHTSGRTINFAAFPSLAFGNLYRSPTNSWSGPIKRFAAIPLYLSEADLNNMTRLAA